MGPIVFHSSFCVLTLHIRPIVSQLASIDEREPEVIEKIRDRKRKEAEGR
jgi:hypothetical protein